MAFTKYLVPAFAIASTAAAASGCSASSTSTISNPAGVSSFAACATYTGDVLLAMGAANAGTVDLSGVQQIIGALAYGDDNTLLSFSAGDLESVGDLTLSNLSALATLSLPALTQTADLNFTGLGSLAALGFGTPGLKKTGNVVITNTNINALSGIDDVSQIDSFSISNNQFLSDIGLNVTDISGAIDIGANDVSNGGQQVTFNNLLTAGQITIRNSSTVTIPLLSSVLQNLGFYGNIFQSLSAPNLTFAGGIVFADNSKLTNITMPLLTTINGTNGTYQIANNTNLQAIDGFEQLSDVKGDLDFSGNFSTVNLPKLSNVLGAMNVQTSANLDCSKINNFGSNQVVKGSVFCQAAVSDPGAAGTTPTGSSSAAASSTGAAAPLDMSAAIGGLSLLSIIFGVM